MRNKIIEILEEDILIILDTINNLRQIHPANEFRDDFIESEKQNLNWTIKLKQNYENKIV